MAFHGVIVIPSINSVCVFLRPVYFAIHSQTDARQIKFSAKDAY